jgi:hypothetical protein
VKETQSIPVEAGRKLDGCIGKAMKLLQMKLASVKGAEHCTSALSSEVEGQIVRHRESGYFRGGWQDN